jgi:hypothetical protein
MGYPRANVRWSDDTDGWELRCESCVANGQTACYWPLTDEFWNRREMVRCRACNRSKKNARDRARGRTAAVIARVRLYRDEAREIINFKERLRYAERREQINARRRARYDQRRRKRDWMRAARARKAA